MHCEEQGCEYVTPELSTEEEERRTLHVHVDTAHHVDNISDVDEGDMYGWTPLHRAARCGMKERCEHLLMRGARVDAENYGWIALMSAANNGHTDVCHLLLDHETDDDHKNKALTLAAMFGHLHACRLLVSRGASVDSEDDLHMTPLNKAADAGYTDICELLLDHGADIEHKTNDGDSALEMAARNGHLDTCKLLLSREADEHKALMNALSENNFKVADFFIKNGASLNWIEEPRRQFAATIAVEHIRRREE